MSPELSDDHGAGCRNTQDALEPAANRSNRPLEELDGDRSLGDRGDRKYIASPETIEDLVHDLGKDLRIRENDDLGQFAYACAALDIPVDCTEVSSV